MKLTQGCCSCITLHIFGSVLCSIDVVQNDLIESNHPICLRGSFPCNVDLSGAQYTTANIVDICGCCYSSKVFLDKICSINNCCDKHHIPSSSVCTGTGFEYSPHTSVHALMEILYEAQGHKPVKTAYVSVVLDSICCCPIHSGCCLPSTLTEQRMGGLHLSSTFSGCHVIVIDRFCVSKIVGVPGTMPTAKHHVSSADHCSIVTAYIAVYAKPSLLPDHFRFVVAAYGGRDCGKHA